MSSDRIKDVLHLVDRALTVEPHRRRKWLDEECKEDPRLRTEVEALLALESGADDLLKVDDAPTNVRSMAALSLDGIAAKNAPLQPGEKFGDYLIVRQIGAGGMGVVYQAAQTSLNRNVALKVLPSYLRDSPGGVARFRREVEAAAKLQHPNIVAVHATGEESGVSYYAMEYIDGPPLSTVIGQLRRRPIPPLQMSYPPKNAVSSQEEAISQMPEWVEAILDPNRAAPTAKDSPPGTNLPMHSLGDNYFEVIANLLAGVADGLDCAHRNNIVHRDIKPSNLLLAAYGRLHISDFGLVRFLAEPGVTQTGEVIGTPYYMAPEQILSSGCEIDGRTDVYALGATLYELLSLRPPLPGPSRDAVLARILRDYPVSPSRINKNVPRDLETICLKCLEKDPHRRYQTAAQLAADFRRFVGKLPIAAKRIGPLARTWKWARRYPLMAASLLLALSLTAVAATFAFRAHELDIAKDLAEGERDTAKQRASMIESDLESAQAAVEQARHERRERLYEQALLAAIQGDKLALSFTVTEAEELGASPGRLHLLRGHSAMMSANFEVALDELNAALQHLPNSLAVHSLISEIYARLNIWDSSIEWLKKAHTLPAVTIEDLILRGRMEAYHDSAAAEVTLDKAITQDRQNVAARLIRGAIRTQRGYDECDAEHAERALEDIRLAEAFSNESSYLLGIEVDAHLTAASGYEVANESKSSAEHLVAAGELADQLIKFKGEYEAHRWRAHYFERVGDLERAVVEWRAIDDKTIGYLIMDLCQLGQFEEALLACDKYGTIASTGTAEFCHSFALSASCKSAAELIADFPFGKEFDDQSQESKLRQAHILWCLAGNYGQAMEDVGKFEINHHFRVEAIDRYRYMRGEITDEEYSKLVAASRYESARANFVIGMRKLARGERNLARHCFEQAVAYRFEYSFFAAMSKALLAQLDRDPEWPPWIVKQAVDQTR